MVTIAEALNWANQQLQASESPAVDSRALLCCVLAKPRSYLMTWPERTLTEQQHQQLLKLVAERRRGVPVAHLTGQREFWSLPLAVNDSTLIPRPDTETLVEAALSLDLPDNARVLDLGTGTGAIALALKSERPQWQITAVDQSEAAVALASHNAEQLQLPIEVKQSNWFSAISVNSSYDLIVSNPPYIDALDPHLQQGDVRYEPQSALIAEDSGLADLKLIVEQSLNFLRPGGWLLVEQGWQQADAVVEEMLRKGYKNINRWNDYGSVERITGARKAGKEGEL